MLISPHPGWVNTPVLPRGNPWLEDGAPIADPFSIQFYDVKSTYLNVISFMLYIYNILVLYEVSVEIDSIRT
jgi:hypothetical protein